MAAHSSGSHPRQSLKVTFSIDKGKIQILRFERLSMIAPPAVGDPPQAGKNGGYWIELRDGNDRVLFHRVLHNPLRDSVEVHSPDGKIERVFGDPGKPSVFDVLLPDEGAATSIVVMGESLTPVTTRKSAVRAAGELARFAVPSGRSGNPGRTTP